MYKTNDILMESNVSNAKCMTTFLEGYHGYLVG